MRVLLLVDAYLPSIKASARLIDDLASELVCRGHEVVIAAPHEGARTPSRLEQPRPGVTVLHVRTGKLKGAPLPLRALNEWRLSANFWRAGRDYFQRMPCDLIVYYSPSIFFGALVQRLKRLWGCPSFLVLRDIFPQWAVDAGMLRRGSPPWWFFRRYELLQYRAASVIGVQSPANLRYFEAEGLRGQWAMEVLYNWAETIDPRTVPQTFFRQKLGLGRKTVFLYAGNIGVAQDMDNLLRLAESLIGEPEVCFLLVGEGSEVARIEARLAARGPANVVLHPAVSQEDYLGLLAEVDVGLICLDRQLKTQNYPGKMLGYMNFSIPILASINPGNDLRDIIVDNDAGLVLLNGEDDALREAALRLARDPALRRRMGASGRALLERRFSVAGAATQLLARARDAQPGAAGR